jgi:hypothetical protein
MGTKSSCATENRFAKPELLWKDESRIVLAVAADAGLAVHVHLKCLLPRFIASLAGAGSWGE